MIIGDPFKFSIITQVVEDWNDENNTFGNGVLMFSIDGRLFPDWIHNMTLKHNLPMLVEQLRDIPVDVQIYNMSKEEAYCIIYNLRFPDWDADEGVSEDYRFDVSPTEMQDCSCYVFAVSDGTSVRFLADCPEYIAEESRHDLSKLNVSEAVLTIEELEKVKSELEGVRRELFE